MTSARPRFLQRLKPPSFLPSKSHRRLSSVESKHKIMGEVVNVIVAFAVIVFIFRWATAPTPVVEPDPEDTVLERLGFIPKIINTPMIDTVSSMFPDIPRSHITYDLLKTGSVEVTSNKILEKGFLEVPPPVYYEVFPRDDENPQPVQAPQHPLHNHNAAVSAAKRERRSLISRYKLHDRISTENADDEPAPEFEIGGKAVWEDTPEKREASLRERKAQMILAARKRMLAAQQKSKEEATASTTGVSTS
ncbi:hypothetical protein ONZ45_g11227 [Pleurotus djamor]|nr:hypothetical protein ONZ45_g11227 [Pleurotus djamor]